MSTLIDRIRWAASSLGRPTFTAAQVSDRYSTRYRNVPNDRRLASLMVSHDIARSVGERRVSYIVTDGNVAVYELCGGSA